MRFISRSKVTKFCLATFAGFLIGAKLSVLLLRFPNDCGQKTTHGIDSSSQTKTAQRVVLSLPPDSGPGVARIVSADEILPGDGPVHAADAAAAKRDFSKQHMNVVAKVRALRDSKRPLTAWQELGIHRTLYVGVVTAHKYLRTRATAINNTWGQLVPKVNFFCPGKGTPEARGLPVISLPGVDDGYPPQKKSFSMLKYMHDELLNNYDWFLRADDDLYLRSEKLLDFLRSLDSQQDIYMGQPGIGFKRDRDRLKLLDGEVYCMGGTGVFYTRGALKKLRPFLDQCLQQVMSYHEDVEVGRCVSRKAGLQCTWNYEMGKLLYYDVAETMFQGPELPDDEKSLKIMEQAMTLHPVKKPEMMYRVHAYYTALQVRETQAKIRQLNEESIFLKRYLPGEFLPKFSEHVPLDLPQSFKPKSRFDVIEWEYFTSKRLYQNVEQLPVVGLTGANKIDVEAITKAAQHLAKNIGHPGTIKSVELLNGYRRVDPIRGVEYVLDVNLNFASGSQKHERMQIVRPFGQVETLKTRIGETKTIINIIVPISGVAKRFEQFMEQYERTCLGTGAPHTALIVVVFSENNKAGARVVENLLQTYREKYQSAIIRLVHAKGEFSRAVGLHTGAEALSAGDLMFFVDADIDMNNGFLARCRKNTVKGKLVYFPTLFMLYNPEIAYGGKQPPAQPKISRDTGHWAHYAYGMVCIYHDDYFAIGGFDRSIVGWGAEDVRLYEKFLKSSKYEVFRAVDPGLFHRWHPKTCQSNLSSDQFKMCIGAMAEGYASKNQLAALYLSQKLKLKSQ